MDEPELRGELERRRKPHAGKPGRAGRALAHPTLELVRLKDATTFGSDPALCDPLGVIGEFKEHPEWNDLRDATAVSRSGDGSAGAPRMRGFWALVYLVFVMSGLTSIRRFYNHYQSTGLWELAEFERRPALSEVYLRFDELLRMWPAFEMTTNSFIQITRAHVAETGRIVSVDSSGFHTRARLEHCCWDADACRAAGELPGATLANSAHEKILEARWKEAEFEVLEVVDLWGAGIQPKSITTVTGGKTMKTYRYFLISGHWYRSLDLTCGFRRYDTGTMWAGGYLQAGVCHTIGLPISLVVAPADVQEWDLYPRLYEGFISAVGDQPYVVTVDRGFAIRAFYEFNTRRGVAVVGGRRKRPNKTNRIDWRTDLYDEHGVPRCPGCGGPGDQSGPGLGLTYTRTGDPKLRFRCLAPACDRCKGVHSIRCDEEWVLLVPLSRLRELYWACRVDHPTLERTFIHGRERHGVAGKDVAGRLYQLGLEPQRLRAHGANLLNWFRLCLRHGWIDARTLTVRQNPVELVRLSGHQERSGTLRVPGIGGAKLAALQVERDNNKTDLPYGIYSDEYLRRARHEAATEEAA